MLQLPPLFKYAPQSDSEAIRMNRHQAFWGVAAILCGALMIGPAVVAQTFDVKTLDIKQGSLEIGLDNSFFGGVPRNNNLNRSAHDQSIDYGVREWWRLSAVLKLENPDQSDLHASRVAVENIFVLRPMDEKKKQDVGVGFFASVEASVREDDTNALFFGPIVTAKWDQVTLAANPFLSQTFGRNREEGIAFIYGWQAKYQIREGLAVGIEGFGSIENIGNSPRVAEQEHVVGPVVFTEIEVTKDFKITPDIGLLFGLTRATPDVALKFNIGIPLR